MPGQTTASVYGSSLACKPQIITDNYSTFVLSCVVLGHNETPAGRGLAPTVRWPHQKQLVQVVLNLNSSNSSDVSYPRKHKPSPELCRGGKQLEMRGKYNGETFLIQSSTSQNPSRCGSSLTQMLWDAFIFFAREFARPLQEPLVTETTAHEAKQKREFLRHPWVCCFPLSPFCSRLGKDERLVRGRRRTRCFAGCREVPTWSGCHLLLQPALRKHMEHIGPCCFHKLKGVCDSKSTLLTARHALGQPQQ